MSYCELLKEVEEKLITKTNQYGTVEAAYIQSENEFKLYSEMCIAGKSYCDMYPEHFDQNYYRGSPDWYFVEGEPGDEFGPATYCFITLSEKKKQFEQFAKEYDDILKEKGITT